MKLRRSLLQPHFMTIGALCLVAGIAGCSKSTPTAQGTASEGATAISTSPGVVATSSAADTNPAPSSGLDLSKDYGDGITLATTCDDFLNQHDSSARYDAAIRMSTDFNVDDPGNPMWGFNMDSVCGSDPSMTLGDYFGRAGQR